MATLPSRAKEKLAALFEAEEDSRLLAEGTQRRISELQRILGNNRHGENASDLEDELTRLEVKRTELQQRHAACASINAHLRRWLDQVAPNSKLADAKPAKIKLRDGEDHLNAVQRVRGEISALVVDRTKVAAAGLPITEIKARIKQHVTERASMARPKIIATHDQPGVTVTYSVDNWGPKLSFEDMLCFLDPEKYAKRLCDFIDELPEPTLVLTPAERSERLAAIRGRLLELERFEEETIAAAEQRGQHIARRTNADPLAVLGVKLDPGAATASAA